MPTMKAKKEMATPNGTTTSKAQDATFTLDAALLRDVLQRGGFVRYNISGVLLRFEPQRGMRGMLSVASTDGALLALATMPIDQAIDARIDALVGSDAVAVLAGALAGTLFDEPAPVHVALSADWIDFGGPGWRVVTKRQPGVFPAFEKITGTRPPLRVKFLSREMLSALAFVGTGKRVLVQLDVAPGACALAEVDGDRRAALAVVYDGPPFRAVYNAALLASLIESMHLCCVAWSTNGNTQKPGWSTSVLSPTYFQPDGRDDHTCILMPCKIQIDAPSRA